MDPCLSLSPTRHGSTAASETEGGIVIEERTVVIRAIRVILGIHATSEIPEINGMTVDLTGVEIGGDAVTGGLPSARIARVISHQ